MSNIDHLLAAKNFSFRKLDVTQLDPGDQHYDLVFHFASRASPEEYQRHPIETLTANSQGTQNTLELARKCNAVLVYASTSEVYGDAEEIPTRESYWGKVNPIGPRSCYDEGKRYAEALCTAYVKSYGLDVRIIRIFNTFGPRIRADGIYARAVPRFMTQALSGKSITVHGDGDQTRSFCYITDTVGGILRAATRKGMKGEVINIGSPREITILELAKKIKTIAGSRSKITFIPRPADDPQRRCPDISKARELLNWSPTVALEDALHKTISWFIGQEEG
jgi:UDP-glucuronate decarboxylase